MNFIITIVQVFLTINKDVQSVTWRGVKVSHFKMLETLMNLNEKYTIAMVKAFLTLNKNQSVTRYYNVIRG